MGYPVLTGPDRPGGQQRLPKYGASTVVGVVHYVGTFALSAGGLWLTRSLASALPKKRQRGGYCRFAGRFGEGKGRLTVWYGEHAP